MDELPGLQLCGLIWDRRATGIRYLRAKRLSIEFMCQRWSWIFRSRLDHDHFTEPKYTRSFKSRKFDESGPAADVASAGLSASIHADMKERRNYHAS
jgi:hypothetical protein